MKLENQNILIISNEPWGDIWYSKQNWAYELSNKNKVFFINAPIKWTLKGLFSSYIRTEKYSESLTIINYENRLPLTRFKSISRINEYLICTSLKKWFKTNGIENYIFWTFDPYRFANPKLLNPIRSIYMRVDKYYMSTERSLLKNIDCVIVTAEELINEINYKGNYLVLSHGISDEEFTPSGNIKYEEGFLIYVGNIDFRLDVALIKKMAEYFPKEIFLFIGKIRATENPVFSELFIEKKFNNIIVHGVEHFKQLKNYIYSSKACLAPMDISIHGNAVHHHKSLQYLAMGKPIISPIFNDSINQGNMMLNYSTQEQALNYIKQIEQTETEEKVKNRINFARKYTYTNLIKEVEIFLSKI